MSEVLDTACLWLSRGITPIPLLPKSKKPMFHWKKWQTELPTEKHLKIWFNNSGYNIGIICGMSNIVVVDFDDLEKFREWMFALEDKKWFDIFSNTYSVKTSRGIHCYLYVDRLPTRHTMKDEMIDIKSNGFVLVPPSVHPCGIQYKENNSFNKIVRVESLDELFPPIVHECKKEKTECVIPVNSEWNIHVDENDVTLDDIKNILILDVARWYTTMQRTSDRFWMGCCPKHDDKNPSFRVDTKSNKCTCLSTRCVLNSEYSLDTLDFYAIMENIDKKEAFKQLRKVILK